MTRRWAVRRFVLLLLVGLSGLAALATAQTSVTIVGTPTGPGLTIQEVDGTPSGTITTLKVSNTTLTVPGDGTATLVTGGGGTTGISGATLHGLLVSTGATTATSLTAATNGQLPIGSLGADPVLATLTGTANQIAVVNGPGSITLSIPTNPTLPGTTTANLGNATGLPVSTGLAGLGTGVATFLATPSSANLAAALTNETGTGLLVFATNPVLTTPNLGTPSAVVLTNATGLPFSALTGGTNTTAAMVVGSGASLGPTGTGTITATRVPKQVLTPSATTTPVEVNYNTHNRVRIDELNQTTIFSIPTWTTAPNDGDFLEYSIFCTTQRALIFTTGSTGFSAGHGMALPTACRAGAWVSFGFVWNSKAPTMWEYVATTGAGTGYVHLPMGSPSLPATNPATIDGSENNRRLRFDDTISECAWWQFRMPPDYAGNPVLKWQYSMFSDTNTAHNIAFNVSVAAVAPGSAQDANTRPYATANTCDDAAIPATGGGMKEIACALTNMDSAAAGYAMRLQVCRIPARDNATGDAEGLNAMLEFQR